MLGTDSLRLLHPQRGAFDVSRRTDLQRLRRFFEARARPRTSRFGCTRRSVFQFAFVQSVRRLISYVASRRHAPRTNGLQLQLSYPSGSLTGATPLSFRQLPVPYRRFSRARIRIPRPVAIVSIERISPRAQTRSPRAKVNEFTQFQPNGPATQRLGPLREMVTHLGCRDVAGHARCRCKLGDGSSPAFSGEAMPCPAKPSTRRSGKNVQLRMTDLPPSRPSDGVGISSTDDVVRRISAHRRRARPKDSPSSFLR